jgi:hypothetical protein
MCKITLLNFVNFLKYKKKYKITKFQSWILLPSSEKKWKRTNNLLGPLVEVASDVDSNNIYIFIIRFADIDDHLRGITHICIIVH